MNQNFDKSKKIRFFSKILLVEVSMYKNCQIINLCNLFYQININFFTLEMLTYLKILRKYNFLSGKIPVFLMIH